MPERRLCQLAETTLIGLCFASDCNSIVITQSALVKRRFRVSAIVLVLNVHLASSQGCPGLSSGGVPQAEYD
jgi:hypothetical protein